MHSQPASRDHIAQGAPAPGDEITAIAIELMRALIRLTSVNDGSADSGNEIEAAVLLRDFFAESAAEIEVHLLEPAPGRASIIARLPGADESAPALGLVGHLDVVPADESQWQHDPFAAEIIDGEVWGRGAVDMLYLTASFASVFRAFADQAATGKRLAGDLVFMGVADEEGGSRLGMQWLMAEHPNLVKVDEVLTEAGGMRIGESIAVSVAEKGSAGRRLHISGRSGHASAPYGSENPIDQLGAVVQALAMTPAEKPHVHELWNRFVEARWGGTQLASMLTEPSELDAHLPEIETLAGYAHAVTRTTINPTVVRAGQAHNVIPATATIDLDIRPLPGVTDDDVDALLASKLSTVAPEVRIERLHGWSSSSSPTNSALFETVAEVLGEQLDRPVVPIMAAGGSDARFFRYAGIPAYGFGVMSEGLTYEEYRSRIHSHDERIDLESVRLTVHALATIVSRRLEERT